MRAALCSPMPAASRRGQGLEWGQGRFGVGIGVPGPGPSRGRGATLAPPLMGVAHPCPAPYGRGYEWGRCHS